MSRHGEDDRSAYRLAPGARHIEATWGELDAVLSQRESAWLGNLRIRVGASAGFDEEMVRLPRPEDFTGSRE
jgi:hypothetical protein